MPTVWTVPRSTDARDLSSIFPINSDNTDAATVAGSCCCCDTRVGGAERRWGASTSWCKGRCACGADDAEESDDPSVASAVALSSSFSISSESTEASTAIGTDAWLLLFCSPSSPTFFLLLPLCESPPHPSGNSLSSPPGRSRTSLASSAPSTSARPLPNSRTLCSSSRGNAYMPAVPTQQPKRVAIHPVSGAKMERRTSSNTTALARACSSL